MFETMASEMAAARDPFLMMAPGLGSVIGGRVGKVLKYSMMARGVIKKRRAGQSVAQIAGNMVGRKIVATATKPASRRFLEAHKHVSKVSRDPLRKNGIGGRSWIDRTGIYEMVIIFHDANRAGPHIDVHIGHLSLIYRVKPELYSQLRYNNEGFLTAASQQKLIDHVKAEIATGARVPQNLDHSRANARASWVGGDAEGTAYGSGPTRQIISVSEVDIYKAFDDGPIEMYAPLLSSDRSVYLYRIYPGDGKTAPICIFGQKSPTPPVLEDRLHLKMVDPSRIGELEQGYRDADMSTATAKYDGSSCYVVIGPKGTTVWGPRTSVRTGRRIEYTHKIPGIHMTTNGETIVAMGELLYKADKPSVNEKNHYLPAAVGSGFLNANSLIPSGVTPEIRLYRVDKVGRTSVVDQSFWENRQLQEFVSSLNPDVLKVVESMDPATAQAEGFEGVVVVPRDASVNEGIKVKWWTDPHDWIIDNVAFMPGERGGIAGVVNCTSLESGKQFNLGPGQVGDRELVEHMMDNPRDFEGAVIKVNSRHGHEGRAAKMLAFHDDKGFAPV